MNATKMMFLIIVCVALRCSLTGSVVRETVNDTVYSTSNSSPIPCSPISEKVEDTVNSTSTPIPDSPVNENVNLSLRTFNGTVPIILMYPYMVSIRKDPGTYICGGIIVHDYWILTAAHCVVGHAPRMMYVRAGTLKAEGGKHRGVLVVRIDTHPGYAHLGMKSHDIAMLKLETPLVISSYVSPAQLPESIPDPMEDSIGLLIGWGIAADGAVMPDLQQVKVKVMAQGKCMERYKDLVHSDTICTGVPEGRKIQCNGDFSGGAFLIKFILAGVISYSQNPCGMEDPALVISIYPSLTWIRERLYAQRLALGMSSSPIIHSSVIIVLIITMLIKVV